MERVTDILSTVLPVVVMLFAGMVLRSRNILSREGIDALKKVVVNITLPAVLIGAFATTSYTVMDIIIPLVMFIICLAGWGLGRLFTNIFHVSSWSVPFLTTGFEAGMLGYALFNMLYGSDNTADFARIDLGQVLFVFTLYKLLIGMQKKQGVDTQKLVREMVVSPTIIAIVVGVILGASGLYKALEPSGISDVFDSCVDFVSAPTGAIILLTIGYDLVIFDIPWIDAGKVVILRFFIMFLLRTVFVFILNAIMPGSKLVYAANVMFILPPPFVLPVFADDADSRVYISSILSLSTIVSIIGFAVLAVIG